MRPGTGLTSMALPEGDPMAGPRSPAGSNGLKDPHSKEEEMDVLSKKDFGTHLAVVGWLQIVNSLLGIFAGIIAATLILGVGVVIEDAVALRMMTVTAAAIGGLLFVLGIPGLVAGIGLLRRASWSRVMALVLSAFELVLFPIGTILAAYTVFVLSQQAAVDAFGACCSIEDGHASVASA